MDDDWPAMDRGIAGPSGAVKQALDRVHAALVSSESQGDGAVLSGMLRQLEVITQSRRA